MRSISKIREGLGDEEELSNLKVLIKRRIGPTLIWVMGIKIFCACTSFITLILISVTIPGIYSTLGTVKVIGVMLCYVGFIYVLFASLRGIKKIRNFKLVLNKVMDAETPEDLEGTIVEKFLEENS